MGIRTIFNVAEDCARGERTGWAEFVRDFAGIGRTLLTHYFPSLGAKPDELVVAVFQRAESNQRAWFAGLSFTNEREFMMAFRSLVFSYARERLKAQPANAQGSSACVTAEQSLASMKDLLLLEREVLWLLIKGYDAPRIAATMMNAAATAESVERVAGERLRLLFPGVAPEQRSGFAAALLEMAEGLNTESCVSLKSFNNLVNGQITWREREAAEQHMSNCLYCIDRFTSFQEMVRLRKDTPPLAPPQVQAILAQLQLAPAKSRGVLSRLLAGR